MLFPFAAFLGLQCVHLAWMTLKRYSKDGLKNRKLQILCGQQSPKTKYRSQGKEKKTESGFCLWQNPLVTGSLHPPRAEGPTSRARKGSPGGTAHRAGPQSPAGVNVESLLSAGRERCCSGFAHSPFFLGLFFQNGHLSLRYSLWGGKTHCFPFRPGCCAKHGLAEAYKTSIDFPDETLSFIKSHPLMDSAVPPIADEPWFTKTRIR